MTSPTLVAALALAAALFGVVAAFPADGPDGPATPSSSQAARPQISVERLKQTIDFLAADEQGGRIPGSAGHLRVCAWLRDQLEDMGLRPGSGKEGFLQAYMDPPIKGRYMRDEGGGVVRQSGNARLNVLGFVPGADPDLAHEFVVFMAHYDHLGLSSDGKVYNGAFDNAGGVAVALEVARVLSREGAAPRRSVLFLLTDGEESGLTGARAWLKHPTVPLDHVVMAFSADPLGRRLLPDYGPIILSGLERSPTLLKLLRGATDGIDADVAFVNRDIIPIFHSDQDPFHEAGIAATWFVNPGFSFYHQVGDTADTIDYRMLREDARFAVNAVRAVANDAGRYEYLGSPPMDAQTALDAKVILAGVLGSKFLTDDERRRGVAMVAKLDQVIEAGRIDVLENPKMFFFQAVSFLFEVSRRHPGEIPPPFPED